MKKSLLLTTALVSLTMANLAYAEGLTDADHTLSAESIFFSDGFFRVEGSKEVEKNLISDGKIEFLDNPITIAADNTLNVKNNAGEQTILSLQGYTSIDLESGSTLNANIAGWHSPIRFKGAGANVNGTVDIGTNLFFDNGTYNLKEAITGRDENGKLNVASLDVSSGSTLTMTDDKVKARDSLVYGTLNINNSALTLDNGNGTLTMKDTGIVNLGAGSAINGNVNGSGQLNFNANADPTSQSSSARMAIITGTVEGSKVAFTTGVHELGSVIMKRQDGELNLDSLAVNTGSTLMMRNDKVNATSSKVDGTLNMDNSALTLDGGNGTLTMTDTGIVNLTGSSITGNVDGLGRLNFNSTSAKVNGTVSNTTNVAFTAGDNNLKESITGRDADGQLNIQSLDVNAGSVLGMYNDKANTMYSLVDGTLNMYNSALTLNVGNGALILSKNGTIGLDSGSSITGDVSGNGRLIFSGTDAKVNGIVGGVKLSFNNGTYNLKKAITGRDASGQLNVNSLDVNARSVLTMTDDKVNATSSSVGGTLEMDNSTLTVNKGKGTLSLDGTVNLGAGSLIKGTVSGGGQLHFKGTGATITGDVNDGFGGIYFDTDYTLSHAIQGAIGQYSRIYVTKGTLTYDRDNTDIGFMTVEGGASLDIGTNSLGLEGITFENNSILKVTVADKSTYGNMSVNNGGSISPIGTKLDFTLNSSMLKKGESTTVDIIRGPGPDNDFAEITSNSRYDIEKLGRGSYKITGTETAADTVTNSGGNANNVGTATAWDGVDLSENNKNATQKEVATKLADLSGKTNTTAGQKAYVDALTALAPETSPMVQQTQTEISYQIFTAVANRFSGGAQNVARKGASSGDSFLNRGAMWVQSLFNKAKLDDTHSAKGFEVDTKGLAFGFEKQLDNKIKAGVGYAYSNSDVDGYLRDTDVDTHTALIYGEYKTSNWYVNAIASYGWSDYSEDKKVAGVGVDADYDVETLGLQAMTGYNFNLNGYGIVPETGMRYLHISQDSYKDSAGQDVSGNDSDILTGVLGAKVNKTWHSENGMLITPEVRAAMTYDLKNDKGVATVGLDNGSAYITRGTTLDKFGVELGAGITAEISNKFEFYVGYEGKFRDDYQDHTGLLNAKYKF